MRVVPRRVVRGREYEDAVMADGTTANETFPLAPVQKPETTRALGGGGLGMEISSTLPPPQLRSTLCAWKRRRQGITPALPSREQILRKAFLRGYLCPVSLAELDVQCPGIPPPPRLKNTWRFEQP